MSDETYLVVHIPLPEGMTPDELMDRVVQAIDDTCSCATEGATTCDMGATSYSWTTGAEMDALLDLKEVAVEFATRRDIFSQMGLMDAADNYTRSVKRGDG